MMLQGRRRLTLTSHTFFPPAELLPRSPLAEPNPKPDSMGASRGSPYKPASLQEHRVGAKRVENEFNWRVKMKIFNLEIGKAHFFKILR